YVSVIYRRGGKKAASAFIRSNTGGAGTSRPACRPGGRATTFRGGVFPRQGGRIGRVCFQKRPSRGEKKRATFATRILSADSCLEGLRVAGALRRKLGSSVVDLAEVGWRELNCGAAQVFFEPM